MGHTARGDYQAAPSKRPHCAPLLDDLPQRRRCRNYLLARRALNDSSLCPLSPESAHPGRRSRFAPSRATVRAVAVGAALFWLPAVALKLRLEPQERFLPGILLFAVLLPLSLFLAWRAWFDAPTRAERLASWVRLALLGPYVGAVLVGAGVFFLGGEFAQFQGNPQTPAAAGILLPVALLTVRAGLAFLQLSTFAAFGILLIITVLLPRGAMRVVE